MQLGTSDSQEERDMLRQRVEAGAYWGPTVGYSRAVRAGNFVYVAGTTASAPDGTAQYPGDAEAQTREALRRIEQALGKVGATLADVVRTRIFLTNVDDWTAVGRVHGEAFADIRPGSTMVEVSALLHPDLLVEIEADAVLDH